MTAKKEKWILIVSCLMKDEKKCMFVEANNGTSSCVICNESVTVLT